MKRKLIIFMIILLLVIPCVVKADMTNIKYIRSNDNIVVGGDFDISFVIDGYNTELTDFTFEYDKTFLEIFRDNIQIKSKGIVVYGFDNSKFVNNENVSIEVSNGKIILSFTEVAKELESVLTGSDAIEISANFKTLKEGNTKVTLKSSDGFVNTSVTANIKEQNIKSDCKCVNEKNIEVKKENIEEEKDSENILSMPLYISLGLNILLILLMFTFAKGKKKN